MVLFHTTIVYCSVYYLGCATTSKYVSKNLNATYPFYLLLHFSHWIPFTTYLLFFLYAIWNTVIMCERGCTPFCSTYNFHIFNINICSCLHIYKLVCNLISIDLTQHKKMVHNALVYKQSLICHGMLELTGKGFAIKGCFHSV